MVKYSKIVLVVLFGVLMNSCSLLGLDSFLDRGYYNDEGKYVPKYPNYKLKDKKGFVFPENLDTNHVYKHVKSYYLGVQKFPYKAGNYEDGEDPSAWCVFMKYYKFYSNGRINIITTNLYDEDGSEYILQEKDMNPRNYFNNLVYYYSKDGKKIQIEKFYQAQDYGSYHKYDCFINKTGDSLIHLYKDSKIIYVLDSIPAEWNTYKADW